MSTYRVYSEGSNGGSTLAGTTSGTSLSLSGLTVGDGYTYNVVAVDSQGNTSLPSPPVTFTAVGLGHLRHYPERPPAGSAPRFSRWSSVGPLTRSRTR